MNAPAIQPEITRIEDLLQKYGIAYPYAGAETKVGWLPLIEDLIVELLTLGWDKDCHQIKEKFGGLRFYIGGTTPEIDDAITRAERESMRTCETCGRKGVLRTGGWLQTLCDEHAQGREAVAL